MPVMATYEGERMLNELDVRFARLRDMCALRELRHPREGCKRKASFYRWNAPEKKRATVGTVPEIALALADFKAILEAYKKLR